MENKKNSNENNIMNEKNEMDNDKKDVKENMNENNINEIKDKTDENIINEDSKENKNKIIIKDHNEIKANEEYFQKKFNYFEMHYDKWETAIQNDIKDLKKRAFIPSNRDLLWLIFLGVLPYNLTKNWNQIISEERTLYLETKKELITKDIEEFIITKKIKDKYSAYFKFKDILSKEDYDFLDIIKVDVTRTFQKMELFKQEIIQKTLINILFIFAKKNKGIGYRQGMSDLCAIFLYVLYKEKILDTSYIEDNKTFIFYLLYSNNEFLEHDTYALFSRFMLKGYAQFFLYNDEQYMNGDLSKIENQKKKLLKKNDIINSKDSELKKRIYLVYYLEFPLADKQLYQFMIDKIEPEIFMVRWYLCAFSREFSIPQLVELWDLILLQEFIEDKNKNNKNKKNNEESKNVYKFVDYIILSMLVNIKEFIMKKKTSSELMAFLMKYPKDIDVKKIYDKSLEIYNKNKNNIKI